jgi:hypothetical protein
MAQQGGLAATAQPHDGNQLPLGENHVDALQDGAFIVSKIKVANFDQRR